MDAMLRFVAAAMLAVLLPVQGYAAACAQICAVTNGTAPAHQVATVAGEGHCAEHAPKPAPSHGDGEDQTLGAGKCCQAHVFTVDQPASATSVERETPVRAGLAARWSSFIPDEPSPPPIPAANIA